MSLHDHSSHDRNLGESCGSRIRNIFPRTWLWVLVSCALDLSGAAWGADYQIGRPLPWIETRDRTVAISSSTDTLQEGVAYLLIDSQYHVGTREHYGHYARQFLTAEGVRSSSQIRINFDPSYQTLTLHHVSLVRDGTIINQLPAARIEVIQRETELTAQIYDGSVTTVIFPADVRVGDVLDYSFSIQGWNPVFGGRAVGRENLEWATPVARRSLRVLVPKGREVGFRNHRGGSAPSITAVGDATEYRWEAQHVPALRPDDDLPVWFEPFAFVEWSEYSDWAEVIRWAQDLYPPVAGDSPELDALAREIREAHSEPLAAAREALRFVQDDIRYLGFEIGPDSHQPSEPVAVLQRRFGDCKDKSYLLCALLSRLGVDARPALVNTERRDRITELLPSPLAFDHVICRLRVAGTDYWVDPTRSRQARQLGELVLPHYGKALVVETGGTDISDVPKTAQATQGMVVVDEFLIQDLESPVEFVVTTTYEGAEAERQRWRNSDTDREKLQTTYLNFYAKAYPGIAVKTPLTVNDSAADNQVVVVERYIINNFWEPSEDGRWLVAGFHASAIDELLTKPATILRTMPFAIPHPVARQQKIRVHLPDEMAFTAEDQPVDADGFAFRYKSGKRGRILELDYDYKSKRDSLAATQVAKHIKDVNQARDTTSYYLQFPHPGAPAEKGGINWIVTTIGLLWTVLVFAAAVFAYRHRPTVTEPPPLVEPRLAGIGGWLILVMIGLLVRPLLLGFTIWQNADAYAPTTWHELTTPTGANYHALWAPVLIIELLANIGMLGLSILVIILFFQQRRTFPAFYITLLVGSAVLVVLDSVVIQWLPIEDFASSEQDLREVVRTVTYAVIWSLYALKSRRVKATFRN
jgi:transglutaminase-like putative cysteine protease